MHAYSAYGLQILSDVELQGFPPAVDAVAEQVTIHRGDVPEEPEDGGNDWGNHLHGFAPGIMRFRVDGGHTITYDPLPEADPLFMRTILGGELLAVLLRQRGLLALHASSVSMDGSAIAFVGDSGWGKSTLSTYFTRHGFSLISDDVTCLHVQDNRVDVRPGPASVRLRQDAGRHLVDEYEQLPQVHGETTKRLYVNETREQSQSLPLTAIFLLENTFREEDAILQPRAAHAAVSLLAHTRGNRLLASPEFRTSHLSLCSRLTRSVPVFVLQRRRGLSCLADQFRLVSEAMANCLQETAQ